MNTESNTSYDVACAGFALRDEESHLQGNFESGINAYVECCERHLGSDKVALRAISALGGARELTFEHLDEMSARVAEVLSAQGVVKGDVVAAILPRTPMLIAVILGVWRLGGVYQPLFTAFGSKAIEQRLSTSQAKLIVSDTANREKLDEVENCPAVACVLDEGDTLAPGDIDLKKELASKTGKFEPVMVTGSDLFLMMSTSGTTGAPKGVAVELFALLSMGSYMRHGINLRPDDIYWNIADPGWAYGLYYAVIGPLLLGCATTFSEGAFSTQALYDIVERYGVNNLAGSPTAFRAFMADESNARKQLRGKLRAVSSAGEPLNPETMRWFGDVLDAPVYDHYGQTELGMVVNNHHGLEHAVRPGSAGFALPGYRVVVLDEAGKELGPNEPGDLAVDVEASPLMSFRGYYKKTEPVIVNGYYRTGDRVEFEADGSVSFIGRADDVITSSGYRIGPFDVESALIEHAAVIESAVIGVPDPERTEVVMAFVVLQKGFEPSDELAEELRLHVRNRLSAHAYPRKFAFVTELPKTPSGKIQRFILRDAEKAKLNEAAK